MARARAAGGGLGWAIASVPLAVVWPAGLVCAAAVLGRDSRSRTATWIAVVGLVASTAGMLVIAAVAARWVVTTVLPWVALAVIEGVGRILFSGDGW